MNMNNSAMGVYLITSKQQWHKLNNEKAMYLVKCIYKF